MRALPYGDRAVLFEVDRTSEVLQLRDAFMDGSIRGLGAVVPAARTVLVEFDPDEVSVGELAAIATRQEHAEHVPAVLREVTIPVVYDGADLDTVADLIGESTGAVIARHLALTYTVQFCGFSPGFAYLIGLDPLLHLPRLASPRASVPAGSVAIAGEYAGVYPRSSPGGWRLLGRTDAALFDIDRNPPALLTPGTRVRFEQTR